MFIINAEGGQPRQLTLGESENGVASWSPDGKWIYFASNRPGKSGMSPPKEFPPRKLRAREALQPFLLRMGDNYKGRYFLAEIWATGQDKGRELLETREEQELAKRQEMSAVNLSLTTSGAK